MGDACLLVELDARIDPGINARVLQIAAALSAAGVPGVRDVVPGYASVGVHFDPLRTSLIAIERAIEAAVLRPVADETAGPATVEVPVRYGESFGPDLAEIAAAAGCDEAEVVRLHAGQRYRVYMIGFLPGFAYLGLVPARIALPRHETPRARVPAGSVGIAGEQTGIYPVDSPGGWRIIGRTPWTMFDPRQHPPCPLRPGDSVRFVPIDDAEYRRLCARQD
jgi:inhibitor of KinA